MSGYFQYYNQAVDNAVNAMRRFGIFHPQPPPLAAAVAAPAAVVPPAPSDNLPPKQTLNPLNPNAVPFIPADPVQREAVIRQILNTAKVIFENPNSTRQHVLAQKNNLDQIVEKVVQLNNSSVMEVGK